MVDTNGPLIAAPTDEAVLGLGSMFSLSAARRPDATAVVYEGERWSFARLEADANRLARALSARGVQRDDFVALVLPNSPHLLALVLAALKLGATPLPLSARMPGRELEELVALAGPRLVVAPQYVRIEALGAESAVFSADPLPDVVGASWKAIGTGGSTGRPKIIVDGPMTADRLEATLDRLGARAGMVQLVAGPFYHNAPFVLGVGHLVVGGTIVLMSKFDPARYLELVESERVQWSQLVPTMMHRIAKLDPEVLDRCDLSSLQAVFHTAAACPEWLKRRMIDLFGPERLVEFYGATEGGAAAGTSIRGDEWLRHPGSVGRAVEGSLLEIRDEEGRVVPPGEIGEIWVRPAGGIGFRYIGAELREADGFMTFGDMGSLDDEGYLYIADRRTDMVVSGGANIYPAEVEGAISEHPSVEDVAVVGLPDAEWGQRLHAIVQVAAPVGSPDELIEHCRERLAAYKVPRSWEFVAALPRDAAGKIRRSKLRDERIAQG